MRLARFCILAALGAVAPSARADPPMSGAALGQLEAVLEHCGGVSPSSAERYQAFARALTAGAKEEELAEVRRGEEYRAAYGAATEQLDALPREESEKACAEGLESAR